MWQVLLVEDEFYVRRSIANAIDWKAFGFELAAEAEDGREALAYMETKPVDLVISDIIMPFMDGIELLRQAKERGYEAKFVMLTCVNEFEYARMALQHGASGYILKLSMGLQELQQMLNKIRAELEQRNAQRLSDKLPFVYESIWKSMHGKGRKPDAAVAVNEPPAVTGMSRWLQLFGCVAKDAVSWKDWVAALYDKKDRGKLIVQAYESYGIATVFVWCDEPVPFAAEARLPANVNHAAGTHFVSGRLLPEAWTTVMTEVAKGWYGRRRNDATLFMTASVGQSPFLAANDESLWKEERAVLQRFEQMQWEECRAELGRLWENMRRLSVPVLLVKEAAERLDRWFVNLAGVPGEAKTRIDFAADHDELLHKLTDRIDECAKYRSDGRFLTDHPEINKILDYVAAHYDHDLTLRAMAKYVNMDEQYLSGLFRKKTGETFIQYVQRVRVEQAKFYLRETELVVADIGQRVGFAHLNYFLRVFKKWTGVSPSEFRHLAKQK